MKKVIGGIFFAAIVVVLILLNRPVDKSDQVIKVGSLLILSGDYAKYGEISKNSIQLAVDRYNGQKDVLDKKLPKVEMIYEDTQADAKKAVSGYQKLVTVDKVAAIIGPILQTEITAITPIAEKDKIPVFSISPIPIDRRGKISNPLGVGPDPSLEAGQMAEYVHAQGIRSIAILSTQDVWENEVSKAFKERFSELGGIVTDQEIVLPDSVDTSLPVTKALAGKPDAIFVGTFHKFDYFVKKSKDLGFKGRLYSIEIDKNLAEDTNPYSNGLQFISSAYYSQDFVDSYQSRYGMAPSVPSSQAYDAVSVFLSLIPRSSVNSQESFREDILQGMEKISAYDGVSGKITFSEHRAMFPLYIFQIDGGSIRKINSN